jgi:moderate conductance mechanosensitive channel
MIKIPALCPRLIIAFAALFPAASWSQASPASSAQADTALQDLLTVLQDDTARAALIEKLQATAPATQPQAETVAIARQVVDLTSGTVGLVRNEVQSIWREVSQLLSGGLNDRLLNAMTWAEFAMLAATVATTILSLLALQALMRPLMRKLKPHCGEAMLRRIWKTALATLMRLCGVAAVWALGTTLSASLLNADDKTFVIQSLYLNAFAVFGLCRALLAAVASPDAAHLPALTEVPPRAQRVIYHSIRPVLGLVIQGYMFVLPALQATTGFATIRPVRTMIASLAALVALWAIRRIAKVSFAPPPPENAEASSATIAQGMSFAWRRVWPPLAIAAVLYSWLTALTRPAFAGDIVLGGMVYSALAVLLLIAGLRLAKSAAFWRAPLPSALTLNLPELSPRLSGIGSVMAWILTALLACAAFVALLHGWGAIDLRALSQNSAAQTTAWRLTSALLVVLIAALLWAVIASVIDRNLRLTLTGNHQAARRRTLLGLFRNSFSIALGTLTIMLALSQLGLDIAPLLAGAGVIGLAIGFGSQKLVQDIITGIFIQFEGALNEGDVVEVAGISGGVEKVTIRSLRLRSLDGALHIIPFSSVSTVSNRTRDFGAHVAEIGVAYKERVPDVKDAMQEAFLRLKALDQDHAILGDLDMQGVISLGESAVVVRGIIKTRPGKQWGIGRLYTELVKDVMDERGIEIPYPHRQLVIQGLPAALQAAAQPPQAALGDSEARD